MLNFLQPKLAEIEPKGIFEMGSNSMAVTAPACALCGSYRSRVVSTRGIFEKGGPIVPFTNVLCLNCGLVYVHPQPSVSDTARMYKSRYLEERHHLRDAHRARAYLKAVDYTQKVSQIAAFLGDALHPGVRVLDVGAGLGLVLAYLRDHFGVQGYGVEPSETSVAAAKEQYHIDLYRGTLDEFLQGGGHGSFNIIILHHVLEHFHDPLSKLKALRALLAADGVLYIEVPNILDFRKPVDQFFDFCHLYNFSPRTLTALLEKGGFRVLRRNEEKRYRIQMLAARNPAPAVAPPESAEAARVAAYLRRRRIHDALHRVYMRVRAFARLLRL